MEGRYHALSVWSVTTRRSGCRAAVLSDADAPVTFVVAWGRAAPRREGKGATVKHLHDLAPRLMLPCHPIGKAAPFRS